MGRDEFVLLFDVMDTLVYDPFYVDVPRFFGMTLDELIAAKHPTAWVEFELDRIDEAGLYERFFADGRHFDGPGFKRAMRAAYRWLPGMESLLASLRGEGHVLHALSNYPCWYEMIEEELGLSRYLEWSFVSCKTGVRKPRPGAYEVPLSVLGGPPDRFIVVDDREENCQGAVAMGMRAITFRGADRLRDELRGLGVL